MESLPQLEPTRQLNVDRAYVLLWSHSPDGNRSAFQRVQLRRLGIPTRLVVGCDQEDLTPAQRACMFGSKMYGMPKLPKDERKYASQLVKLWAALLDFARSGLAWSLFVEDDVVVQFPRLPSVNFVLANVRPLGILYVSSYSPIGFDMVSCGVHPRLSWVLGGGRPTAHGRRRKHHPTGLRAPNADQRAHRGERNRRGVHKPGKKQHADRRVHCQTLPVHRRRVWR